MHKLVEHLSKQSSLNNQHFFNPNTAAMGSCLSCFAPTQTEHGHKTQPQQINSECDSLIHANNGQHEHQAVISHHETTTKQQACNNDFSSEDTKEKEGLLQKEPPALALTAYPAPSKRLTSGLVSINEKIGLFSYVIQISSSRD